MVGQTRESTQADLFGALERGDYPKWRFGVQIMPEKDADKTSYNPFDLTKVWPHKDYPLIEIGIVELNRNAENYFAEIEQAAFSPSNIVPGIGFSPDKMLLARIFSYADAHRYRLGTHYEALPVNAPKCPVHHYHKGGAMRFMPNSSNADAYYEPNSFSGPREAPDYREPPLGVSGDADRYNHRVGNDDYSQPRALWNLFDAGQKQRLYSNIAAAWLACQRRSSTGSSRISRRSIPTTRRASPRRSSRPPEVNPHGAGRAASGSRDEVNTGSWTFQGSATRFRFATGRATTNRRDLRR